MRKLPGSFYTGEDVVGIATSLLGKVLVTSGAGGISAGRITEAEAYRGVTDRACHAFGGRRTQRNEVMYAQGGHAYVYICYGIHRLFNVVTNQKDVPDAVLIRGVEPLQGMDLMLMRSGRTVMKPPVTAGPGNLTRALGITMEHNGLRLDGPSIYLADDGFQVKEGDILATPRIGVESAGKDALLPYRYLLRGNAWVSGRKGI
jgi:DNA-3-methyladenine glycosylase